MTSVRSPFTHVGFEFNSMRFAVRFPKIKLRRPRILRRNRQHKVPENSTDCPHPSPPSLPALCGSRPSRKHESSHRSDQNSVSTDPSFTSDDWIKEFIARARCRSGPKLRKPSEDSTDDVETNFYANLPSSHTSTPVSCRILPLNRIETQEPEADKRTRFLPDVSGIKIYETVEIGSDGAGEDLSSDGDYETVFFVNQKITPKTLVRPPRTLKSSCR